MMNVLESSKSGEKCFHQQPQRWGFTSKELYQSLQDVSAILFSGTGGAGGDVPAME